MSIERAAGRLMPVTLVGTLAFAAAAWGQSTANGFELERIAIDGQSVDGRTLDMLQTGVAIDDAPVAGGPTIAFFDTGTAISPGGVPRSRRNLALYTAGGPGDVSFEIAAGDPLPDLPSGLTPYTLGTAGRAPGLTGGLTYFSAESGSSSSSDPFFGLYAVRGDGSITKVVDGNDPFPGAPGRTFDTINAYTADNGLVYFGAFSANDQDVYDLSGVFRADADGNVTRLFADGTFAGNSYNDLSVPSVEDGDLALVGRRRNANDTLVTDLLGSFGGVERVIATNDPLQEGALSGGVYAADVGSSTAAFTFGMPFEVSLYFYDAAADEVTQVLAAGGAVDGETVHTVYGVAADSLDGNDGNLVAFNGATELSETGMPGAGSVFLYDHASGDISKILGTGDLLDGRAVLDAGILSPLQFRNGTLVINAVLDDDAGGYDYALYSVVVPEPATGGLALFAAGGLALRRRR